MVIKSGDKKALISLYMNENNSEIIPLLTVEEAASYLKVNAQTVRAMARRGALPAIKVGRVWRFYKDDIDRFFKQGNKLSSDD